MPRGLEGCFAQGHVYVLISRVTDPARLQRHEWRVWATDRQRQHTAKSEHSIGTSITAVKNEDYDNYAINIFIEHRKENTMPENFATFKLSVENWDEGVEIAISKEMSERVYDKLVDVFYKDYDHLDGFAYETDQLGACGDTTKVFINSNAEYDLNAYFDL